jgi:hypothetical protein
MCFSATASFGVGAALLGVGVATFAKVQEPKQYPFAAIPIVFGLQQLLEGVVWLSLSNPDFLAFQRVATYAYLTFAQAIWPIFVPFAFMFLEPDPKRKKIMKWLTGIGLVIGGLLFSYFMSQTVTVEAREHHIHYGIQIPAGFSFWHGVPYFIVIMVPPFISSIPHMKWLAWSTLASFIAAKIFFAAYLLSVWCFFAAIVSAMVFVLLHKMHALKKTKTLNV